MQTSYSALEHFSMVILTRMQRQKLINGLTDGDKDERGTSEGEGLQTVSVTVSTQTLCPLSLGLQNGMFFQAKVPFYRKKKAN